MDAADAERQLKDLEGKIATLEKRSSLYEERRKRYLESLELRKRWNKSILRFVSAPLIAFSVTYLFYMIVHTFANDRFSPSLRAMGPVLTITSFLICGPLVRKAWFKYQTRKKKAADPSA